MLLNDPLEDFGRAGVVPYGFGIDHGNGAAKADPEAVGFCAVNQWFGTGEAQFFQPTLEKFPSPETGLTITAFRLGLVSAKKDVAAVGGQPESGRAGLKFRGSGHMVRR